MWALLLASAFAADEYRVGVFVGNDRGADGQAPLMFAASDAEKMRDLFVAFGEMEPADAILIENQPRRNVLSELVSAQQRIARAEAQGLRTQLVFYYSGHGDEHGLQLGETTIAHEELRAWLEQTGADVRVAMIDACKSGAAVRQKGGVRGASYAFAVDVEDVRGTAFLTSSAASEFSQESDELGGGFFTHYLHTALSGAADADRDGIVSLAEAYAYVHTETAFATRGTPGAQTPAFDFDLSGSGPVRLTDLTVDTAWIAFPGGLEGTYAIWDESRKRYVAEVSGAEQAQVAVPRGHYFVHRRMPGWVDEASYHVGDDERVHVDELDFVSVAYEETAARGDLQRQARRAYVPPLSVHLAFGSRGFGRDTIYSLQYLPPHSVGGMELRQRLPHDLYASVDFLHGQSTGALYFDELATTQVIVGSTSIGGTFGLAPGIELWGLEAQAGFGARVEAIGFRRSFPHGEAPSQAIAALAPGASLWIGGRFRRVSWDLTLNPMILPVDLDDPEERFPGYGEGLLRLGYRL